MELSCPPNNLLSTTIPQIKFAPPTPEPPARADFGTPGSLTSTDSDAPFKWSSVPELGSPPRWRPQVTLPTDVAMLATPIIATSNSSNTSQLSDDYYSCVPEEEEDGSEEFSGCWEDTECDEEIKRITGSSRSQASSPEPTLLPPPHSSQLSPALPTNTQLTLAEQDASQQALLPTAVISSTNCDVNPQTLLLCSQNAVEEDDDPPCDGDQYI